MHVRRLELFDFRNYTSASFELGPGTTAVVGDNGQGKTNLAEALAYLATLQSFRGVAPDALVRVGAEFAVVRAEVVHDDGRTVLVEAEINRAGRNRVLVNRQRLVRSRDLLGVLRVTVFSPDDLDLVKGAPALRRAYLDDALVALAPKHDGLLRDIDRIIRQRNTLLKQAGGRLDQDAAFTLEVWDAKLAAAGDELGAARARLVADLGDELGAAYHLLSGDRPVRDDAVLTARYEPEWLAVGLGPALAAASNDDVRRQVTTVGPHRDDLDLFLDALPARSHVSQGEQRTIALALRLALHRLVTQRTSSTPVLVLDDVLSELDAHRARALLTHLPAGQVVLTTAAALPGSAHPDAVLHIRAGSMVGETA